MRDLCFLTYRLHESNSSTRRALPGRAPPTWLPGDYHSRMKPDHPVTFKPETAAEAWLGLLARARHRIPVRQRRHRLRAGGRGLRQGPEARLAPAADRDRAAREHGRRHGARLRHGHRPAAGDDGARRRRHRELAQRPDQRLAPERADPVHRRAHADHRVGRPCPPRATTTSTGRRSTSTRAACCASS